MKISFAEFGGTYSPEDIVATARIHSSCHLEPELIRMVKRDLIQQIADRIGDCVELEREFDVEYQQHVIIAKVKVLRRL